MNSIVGRDSGRHEVVCLGQTKNGNPAFFVESNEDWYGKSAIVFPPTGRYTVGAVYEVVVGEAIPNKRMMYRAKSVRYIAASLHEYETQQALSSAQAAAVRENETRRTAAARAEEDAKFAELGRNILRNAGLSVAEFCDTFNPVMREDVVMRNVGQRPDAIKAGMTIPQAVKAVRG